MEVGPGAIIRPQELSQTRARLSEMNLFTSVDVRQAPVDGRPDLRGLEEKLASVPEESILHHAGRNHFSRWLKARTEFALAHELRPRRLSDYPGGEALRTSLIRAIADYRRGLVPLVVPLTLLRHYVRRFDVAYLAGQTYLQPHPQELMLRNHV